MTVTASYAYEPERSLSAYLPFWPSLPDGQKRLLSAVKPKNYCSGGRIVMPQSQRGGFLLVLEGGIRVFLSSPGGRELTMYDVEKGRICSLLPLDGLGTPMLSARRGTVFLHITPQLRSSVVAACPEADAYLLSCAAESVQTALANIERAFFTPLRCSIAHLVLERYSDGGQTAGITHEEIANSFGTTREVVSRELESLRDRGIISTGRGRITVTDRAALESLAGY